RLSPALEVNGVRVTGTADADFRVSGTTSDVGQLKVELTAQGHEVAINGRQTGQLTLGVVTTPGGGTDFGLGALLAIFAPEVARTLAGQVTGELRVAGPLVDEQGNATVDRLSGG